MSYQVGMKVIIVEDCRHDLGNPATGQTATYVGGDPSGLFGTPRFLLQDGSYIYGCECWWQRVEKAGPLPEMQEQLEQTKAVLRAAFEDILGEDE